MQTQSNTTDSRDFINGLSNSLLLNDGVLASSIHNSPYCNAPISDIKISTNKFIKSIRNTSIPQCHDLKDTKSRIEMTKLNNVKKKKNSLIVISKPRDIGTA
jgi:hypothetical protein